MAGVEGRPRETNVSKSVTRKSNKRDFEDAESGPLLGKKDGGRGETYSISAIILPFLFPALGGLLFGYDIGATSGAVISLTSPELSGTSWYDISSIQEGLLVSGSLYGALPGSLLAFSFADSLGRRRELMVAATAYMLGSLASAFAPSIIVLIIGRLIYGIGLGLAMHAAPLYISETAPPQIRGTMVSTKEIFNVIGILLGYLAGILEIDDVGGWRIMYGVGIPIAIIMGVGMWWLPPSPRWILLQAVQGKTPLEEAKRGAKVMFQRLRGDKVEEADIDKEMSDTLESVRDEGQDEVTFGEIFRGKLNQKAFLIGGGLVFLQQFTGQPSVLYYAAKILQSAGFPSASDATKVSVYLGIWKLLLTLVATFYVDKLGRRPLLITGVSGITVSLLSLAAYYSFASGLNFLGVGALLIYVGSYQLSFGPISWVIVSEVFPLRTRGKAVSLTTLLNFASNAVVAFAFSPLQALVGASITFLIFAVIGVFSVIFVVISVPETKGLTLEQIEAKLSK